MVIPVLKNKGKKFLYYHLLFAIFFAFAYYLQDYFIVHYTEIAKKLFFINNDYDASHDYVNSFLYYLWFSLITQTTVGYSGLVNSKTGLTVPWSKINYRSFKVINLLQLISIFSITAMLF